MRILSLSAAAVMLGGVLMTAGPAAAWHRDNGHGFQAPAYSYYYGPPRHVQRHHWRYWRHHRGHGWHDGRRHWDGWR